MLVNYVTDKAGYYCSKLSITSRQIIVSLIKTIKHNFNRVISINISTVCIMEDHVQLM